MLGKSHQRRASSISAISSPSPQKSFLTDIEKYADVDEADAKRMKPKKDVLGSVIMVLVYLLCVATFINLLLLRANLGENGVFAAIMKPFVNHHETQPSSEVQLINMAAIGASGSNADDELWKLDDHNKKNSPDIAVAPGQQPPVSALGAPVSSLDRAAQEALTTMPETPDTINPQGDLLEILSVSPIVILSSSSAPASLEVDDSDSPQDQESLHDNKLESQVMEIMLGFLRITPEPRVVDLAKHPHHNEIVHYLQSYSMHTAENEDDEVVDIPRVFIGGQPIANHKQVVEKYYNKDLIEFLKHHGKGIINVE